MICHFFVGFDLCRSWNFLALLLLSKTAVFGVNFSPFRLPNFFVRRLIASVSGSLENIAEFADVFIYDDSLKGST